MNTARGCDIASARRHHTRLAIDFHCHRTLKNEDLQPVAVLVLLAESAGREAVNSGVSAILAFEDLRLVHGYAGSVRRMPFYIVWLEGHRLEFAPNLLIWVTRMVL